MAMQEKPSGSREAGSARPPGSMLAGGTEATSARTRRGTRVTSAKVHTWGNTGVTLILVTACPESSEHALENIHTMPMFLKRVHLNFFLQVLSDLEINER